MGFPLMGRIQNVLQLHYMIKSMWTPAHRTSHSEIMGINVEFVNPFAAITASTLLGRLLPLDVGTLLKGDLIPFGHKSIREVGH
jgi:hypothetical protein